ncbi:MAG: glycosyltransferase family 2 protein [Halobacteriovoraceae bacterium]|nr:glycosyltransferase family 2 protein [Halobacteriovoraceae bacterium]MBT5096068.1 glycosyltransferase family 2 protein [Halobacteriovoraceae bacterium]
MKVFLGIPCYNCGDQITRVLSDLLKEQDLLQKFSEVYLIDNQSSDETIVKATSLLKNSGELGKKIKLVVNNSNYGLGGSFKIIYGEALKKHCDYLVWLHGDDQVDLKDLKKMVAKLLEAEEKPDALFGARFMPGSELQNYSKAREIANLGLNKLCSLISGKKVFELGSGLNAYRLKGLSLEELKSLPDHLAFDMYLTLHFLGSEFRSSFIPIRWKNYDQKSNANNLLVTAQILTIMLKWKLGFKRSIAKDDPERGFKVVFP